MRRNAYIALGAVVLAWAVLAIVLGSPTLELGSDSGASAQASPACLPSTFEHSAVLPGSDVEVSPAPGTGTANPKTQISFLGVPAAEIKDVSVVGRESGGHGGRLAPYSQGDGASFAPNDPFQAGEQVSVHALVGAKRLAFQFRVDTPYSTANTPEFPAPKASPSELQSFYTTPGVQAPVMSVTVRDRDPGAGDIFTTNGPGPGQFGPLIYTAQGRLVWFQQLSGGEAGEDLNEQTYEGRRVLTWWKGRVLSLGFGQGEDIVMNSHYQTIARVPGGNGLHADLHDFQIAAHGIAYITAFNPIHCDLTSVHGVSDGTITDTAIQQIDIKTGLVRWEWHSLDHVAAAESEVETPSGTNPWDYFHLNSIDPESDGNLLISARSTWAAYQLDGASGKILWRLGGNKSSFKMGPGTRTAWQHDGRVLPDGDVTLFDDGANPPIHKESRAIRIRLDSRTHEAHLISSYTHPNPAVLAASQGNAQTLSDGNTLVGYGGAPAISEYAKDGTLLLDAHQPYDMSFYRAYRYPWSALPADPPAVLASLNNTAEETIVYASWNGATSVASWRVLAGTTPGSWSARAPMAFTGFESSTLLPKKYAYVAVQALDDAGHVLGTSKATRVISFTASLAGAR